jgi:hypothetical protein
MKNRIEKKYNSYNKIYTKLELKFLSESNLKRPPSYTYKTYNDFLFDDRRILSDFSEWLVKRVSLLTDCKNVLKYVLKEICFECEATYCDECHFLGAKKRIEAIESMISNKYVKCDYCKKDIPKKIAKKHKTEENKKEISIWYCEKCFDLKQIKK